MTYLAATPETAWKEVTNRWGADPAAYWMVQVSVRLTSVADLTDPATQARYDVDERVLTEADHGRCQQLGERLRADGFEGLMTFSRADHPGGRQVVLFLDPVRAGSRLRVTSTKPVGDFVPPSRGA